MKRILHVDIDNLVFRDCLTLPFFPLKFRALLPVFSGPEASWHPLIGLSLKRQSEDSQVTCSAGTDKEILLIKC
jgi:hypothetical protein